MMNLRESIESARSVEQIQSLLKHAERISSDVLRALSASFKSGALEAAEENTARLAYILNARREALNRLSSLPQPSP